MVLISAVNGTPHHDEKEKVETSRLCPLSSLPEELALNCFARVSSPSDYKALSRVSKRYRSLLVSDEVYKKRLLMDLVEKCHYICIRNLRSLPCWHILRREETKLRLIPIPSLPPQYFLFSSVVVLDWGIYVIGGFVLEKTESCDVFLFDCRTNIWRKLPSMAVARSKAAVGVIDGKIYVFGGCKDIDSSKWGEVFDPKTQAWETLVPLPDRNTRLEWINASLVMEEKLYAVENFAQSKMLYYSPKEGKWGSRIFDSEPFLDHLYVMIDKFLYIYSSGKLFWCEKEEFIWKEVKGLDSFLRTLRKVEAVFYQLINFGGNIVVIWRVGEPSSLEIWFAEISLERREDGDEIWGMVEWLDSLITLDRPPLNFGLVPFSVSVNL